MNRSRRVGPALRWLMCFSLATGMSGCASMIEDGLRSLAGDGGPPGTEGQYGAPRASSGRAEAPGRNQALESGYQHAPTLDWFRGAGPRPYAPGRSLWSSMSPRRVSCQAVPAGLAQVYSGPTGPAASPLWRFGPFELGVASTDGALDQVFESGRDALVARAFSSGARMASEGPTCGKHLFLYLRIGPAQPDVSVLR